MSSSHHHHVSYPLPVIDCPGNQSILVMSVPLYQSWETLHVCYVSPCQSPVAAIVSDGCGDVIVYSLMIGETKRLL